MNSLFRALVLLPLLGTLQLLSQQPAPAPGPPGLTLDVTVTNHSGKPVAGLLQENFTVLDNGVPQPILAFKAIQAPSPEPPIQIILLIDSVNTSLQSVAYEREQIEGFLHKAGPTVPYPVSFVFLSDSGVEIQNSPSRNTAALLANLNQLETKLHTIHRSSGYYGAVERLQLSLKAVDQIAVLEQQTPGRKLMIWISPGWPYLTGPGINLTANNQRQIFSAVVALSTELQRARITLYSIDPLGLADAGSFRTSLYGDYLKGVAAPKDVQQANLALQVLAEHTGGAVLNSTNDISAQISMCIDDASAFYVLTVPRAAADSPPDLHSIQVKLPDTKLKARTLFGYYTQP
jgi:VWFA-related protein